MPVDEHTFAAEIAGWVTEYLGDNPDLPFGKATVEEHVDGTIRRHDFRLYHRQTQLPRLAADQPPARVPSRQECRFCDITAADYPERMDEGSEPEGKTTSDF